MRAVIYACVDAHNATEEYISAQVSVCQSYASQNGLAVLGTYIDRNVDGSRPGFQQMLNDSARRLFDEVLVFKTDRFAVTRNAHSRFKAILKDNGVRVLSATEFIPETPEGVLIESMLEGMSEYTDIVLHSVSEEEESTSLADSVADIAEVIPGFGAVSSAIKAVQGVRDVTDAVSNATRPSVTAQGFPQVPPQSVVYPQPVSHITPPLNPTYVNAGTQSTVQVPHRTPIHVKKPKKDMENFFGKHIAAILAGVLIIAATVTSIFMAWGVVSPAVRFLMLAVFGSVMLSAALIRSPKLPEFLSYPVIRNLFASAGLVVLFITFLLGHSVLALYPIGVAALLLAVWGGAALFILHKFNLVSACVVGALGMSVGCWVTTYSNPNYVFSLAAVALGCVYLIAALFEYCRQSGRKIGMYILYSLASMAIFASPMPVLSAGGGHTVLAVLIVVSTAAMASIFVSRSVRTGSDNSTAQISVVSSNQSTLANIVYFVVTGIFALIFLFEFGGDSSTIYSLCLILSAAVFIVTKSLLTPVAVASMAFAVFDDSFIVGGYTVTLLALSIGILYLSVKGHDESVKLRKFTSSTALVLTLFMSAVHVMAGFDIMAGLVMLMAAFVACIYAPRYCPEPPFGQLLHLSGLVVGVAACYVVSPDISGIGEFFFITLSGVLAAAYIKFGYNPALDTPLYRNLLLPACSVIAAIQGGFVLSAAYPWVAFAAALSFAAALFYRFIIDSRSPKNSVSALWVISGMVFLWMNFLAPEGLDVVPSVIMIAVGFAVISFGFARRRNAERISGLVLVILCTIKAVSFDVWFAAPPIRVVALFVGAGICIAVSRLYAKQSAELRGSDRAEE